MQSDALIDEILFSLDTEKTLETKDAFHRLKNAIFSKYATPQGMDGTVLLNRYRELISEGKLKEDARIWKILRKRAVRSLSGISVISLLTKFW